MEDKFKFGAGAPLRFEDGHLDDLIIEGTNVFENELRYA